MKVKELIEKLQQFDPELDVVAGSEEDDDITAVYHCNVWKGSEKPSRKCVWIDTKAETDA